MRAPPILLLLCTLGSMSPAALAGDLPVQSAETTAMTDKSRQLFQEGVAAYNKGKLLEAQASFLAAWSLHPHWQIAGNLADIETELHKYREAAEHATYYAKHAPADRHDKAEAMVKRAVAQVGTLAIDVDAAGADVLVDGAPVGRAPLADPVFVDPGEHKVTVRFPGRPDAVRVVTLAAGGVQAVSIKVLPQPLPPQAVERRVLWPVAVGGGLTAALLAVGIGATVASNGHRADSLADQRLIDATGMGCILGANPTTCAKLDAALASTDTYRKLAVAGYVGAGAVAVATTAYLLWPGPKTRTASGFRVLPLLGPTTAGLAAEGGF